jgi:hypothetical protein
MKGEPAVTSDEDRPGYYKDKYGNWQRDRRTGDRRRSDGGWNEHERRKTGRRREDRDLDRDHNEMIEEALSDFVNGDDDAKSERA